MSASVTGSVVLVPLYHVAQGIAHQDALDAGVLQQRGEARVVAGEHGNLAVVAAQLLQISEGNGFVDHGDRPEKDEGSAAAPFLNPSGHRRHGRYITAFRASVLEYALSTNGA